MSEYTVHEVLKKLESNERIVILHSFLESLQDTTNVHNLMIQQENNGNLSDILLDIIHIAFTTGFEVAIESVISSFKENTIE